MRLARLAVIIPTLNEQGYIGKLLESIASQTVLPAEIVVVDAFSKDKTILEIKEMQKVLPQLRYFQIPKFTIARQRNLGVKKTKSPQILFLDADVELKKDDTLEEYLDEVHGKKPDLAAAINLPNSKYWKDWVYFIGENSIILLSKLLWPAPTGRNIFINRSLFEKIGGFDEKVAVGEDMEMVQRASKRGGKFVFLSNPKIYTSTRRLQKD